MKLASEEEFFHWCLQHGIEWNHKSFHFSFQAESRYWDLWASPSEVTDISRFVWIALQSASEFGGWWIYPRGTWGYNDQHFPYSFLTNTSKLLGIPTGHSGAAYFQDNELHDVLLIALAYLTSGLHTGTDLFIVSGDGNCILMTDHHQSINAEFLYPDLLKKFTQAMSDAGFEDREPPDETYKPSGAILDQSQN